MYRVLLSPERKAELLNSTKEAAFALIEDIQHIRQVVANDSPSNADIRRLSGFLRRIIVDPDLAAVSAPRLGRVNLIGPDNNSAYRSERKRPFLFFMSGRVKILGGWSGTIFAYDVVVPKPFGTQLQMPEIRLEDTVELTLDTFRSQKVLCYRGEWVSRQAVIKYVANVASGVHSGNAKTGDDKLLGYIRNSARLRIKEDGSLHLDLFPKGVDVNDNTFQHDPNAIDPVLIELLAAATFLVKSPFIAELEKFIQEELREK